MTRTNPQQDAPPSTRKGCFRIGCLTGLACFLLTYGSLALWSYSYTHDLDERWARLEQLTGPVSGTVSEFEVVTRVDGSFVPPPDPTALDRLVDTWAERWNRSPERADLEQAAEELLQCLAGDPRVSMTLRYLVEEGWIADALDAAMARDELGPGEFRSCVELTRRLQALGDATQFWLYGQSLRAALESARGNPDRIEVLRSLPPPRPEEAFEAMCRAAVLQDRRVALDLEWGNLVPILFLSPEEMRRVYRLALLDRSLGLEARKSSPGTWDGPVRKETFGIGAAIGGVWLRLTRAQVRMAETSLQWYSHPNDIGPDWAETLELWHEVVDP